MGRNLLILLLFLLPLCILLSCKKAEEKPPVARDKMAGIIADLQIAETYSLGLSAQNDSNVRRFTKNTDSLYVFYSSILEHYQLSFDSFNQAIDWYKNHPAEMDSLLNTSLDCLNKAKARLGILSKPDEIKLNQLQVDSANIIHQPPVLHMRDSLTQNIPDTPIYHKITK
ncbi:MAG TPA: DUF4296 domain-containing protein [Edaphocola sp.]|nr:DUF4296 domain-containing protein [Edaphocola sp.]